jgi:flagellar motor component MotA
MFLTITVVSFIIIILGVIAATVVTTTEKELARTKIELNREREYTSKLVDQIKLLVHENKQLRYELTAKKARYDR